MWWHCTFSIHCDCVLNGSTVSQKAATCGSAYIHHFRAYRTKKKIVQAFGPDLSVCPSVAAMQLFNGACPICWSEWSDLSNNQSLCGAAGKCIVALQCNHALCRDCLTTMELTKLSDYCLSGALEQDAAIAIANATSTVMSIAASSTLANDQQSDSIRCPCCCRRTAYSDIRRVLL